MRSNGNLRLTPINGQIPLADGFNTSVKRWRLLFFYSYEIELFRLILTAEREEIATAN